jgi:tRNA1Val (adenine37-N6)-methyltransferase
MSIFKFKHFDILQKDSAMKVGTDSMILGSFIDSLNKTKGLDIGSGTGVLSLMIAQKNDIIDIIGVEVDDLAVIESIENFKKSKWGNRLKVVKDDFLNLNLEDEFDLIFSNPPYFQTTNQNFETRKAQARHESFLPVNSLLKKVKKILAPTGSFWVIIPFSDLSIWTEKAKNEGLFIQDQINIKGKIESSFNRSIISFGNNEVIFKSTEFVIRESSGNYSRAYIELTKDFHFNDLNA